MEFWKKNNSPYAVKQTPRGSVVVCGAYLVTDEVKPAEAEALAASLNAKHKELHVVD